MSKDQLNNMVEKLVTNPQRTLAEQFNEISTRAENFKAIEDVSYTPEYIEIRVIAATYMYKAHAQLKVMITEHGARKTIQ